MITSDDNDTVPTATAGRPIKPKCQVFVSSTFQDLREEREAVTWEILKAGHIPVGMENFSADDDRGWKVIERTLQTTDYYVLILAGRYGSIDDEINMSWTEREYRRALELKIPVLAFIRDRKHIPGDQVDMDKRAKRLESLIADVNKRRLREAWTTPDDLRAKVVVALLKSIAEDDLDGDSRPGWYRGTQLPSRATMEELARLSRENHALRDELGQLRLQLSKAPRVAFELLDAAGNTPLLIKQERTRYLLKRSRGTVIDTFSPLFANHANIEKFVRDINRTFWLRLTVKNAGPQPARNVIIDLDIKGAVALTFYPDRAPDPFLVAVRGPTWATDPTQQVHVDDWRVDSGSVWIRQRIRDIGVNREEGLVGIGIRSPEDPEEGFQLTITYLVADEHGEERRGTFDVVVAFNGEQEVDPKTLEKLAQG